MKILPNVRSDTIYTAHTLLSTNFYILTAVLNLMRGSTSDILQAIQVEMTNDKDDVFVCDGNYEISCDPNNCPSMKSYLAEQGFFCIPCIPPKETNNEGTKSEDLKVFCF